METIEPERRARGDGGFTLLEMLLVIAILGALAGVAVMSIGGVRTEATTSACQIEKRVVATAVSAYRSDPATSGAPLTGVSDLANWLDSAPTYWTVDGAGDVVAAGTLPSGC